MEEALTAARVAVELRPTHSKANNVLGAILVELGRPKEAEKHLRHAVELDSSYTRAYHNLGIALSGQGRLEEALAAARTAVEQRPAYVKANILLGEILIALERPKEAEKHLRYAVELDSSNTRAHSELGLALYGQGRHDEALVAMEQAAALEPDSPHMLGLHVSMAQAAWEAGLLQVAAEHYARALRSDPRHRDALLGLARLRFGQRRYDEALPLLQTVVEIEPGNALVHFDMGVALEQLGRKREALQSMDQALALDPTLEEVRAARTRLFNSLEQRGR